MIATITVFVRRCEELLRYDDLLSLLTALPALHHVLDGASSAFTSRDSDVGELEWMVRLVQLQHSLVVLLCT